MYKVFPSFVFRTPRLPITKLKYSICNIDALINSHQLPHIQEAIYIASPSLYEELQKKMSGKISDEDDSNRIIYSAVRYISRMSTRCTPFGLFSGCGIGKISLTDTTRFNLANSINKNARLDMYFLSQLYSDLVKIPEIKDGIKYYPNNSLYKVGNKFRYVETTFENFNRKYKISEIEKSTYFNKVLIKAQKGLTFKELGSILVSDTITYEESLSFIDDLIDSQLLVPELYQSVTGDDLLSRIVRLLDDISIRTPNILNKLHEIKMLLKKANMQEPSVNVFKQILSEIKDVGIPFEEKYLFQLDMGIEPSDVKIGGEIINELQAAMSFLNKITPSVPNEQLNKFRQDFYNRFENREVSLMEALDPEMGIGYPSSINGQLPSPLVDDLMLPQQNGHNISNNNYFQSILLKKMYEMPVCVGYEIIINDKDVEHLSANWNDLPPTMFAFFDIINSDPNNTLIRLKSCRGSSAANLLGRFAHINKEIEELVRAIVAKEQELIPNVIFAEVVHSPEARIGNILSRPHIRDYEILYISDSDLPEDQLILLSDLMLSVKQGRLFLRSKRLNKEILPRLTSAHNYRNSTMPVYHFLCDMQIQSGRFGLFFNLGQQIENEFSFIPRVRYKNTILSLATWIIYIKDIIHLFSTLDDLKMIDNISEWRTEINMPRYVLMPDYDNELFIDWETPLSVRSLFPIIKNRKSVKFTELLYDMDNLVVKDSNNDAYTNECIVPLYKDKL